MQHRTKEFFEDLYAIAFAVVVILLILSLLQSGGMF